jgi:prevent-host-death family protein
MPDRLDNPASWDRNRKGNVAEAAIAFHAARLGIEVCRPLLEHGRYDLVMEIGGRLQRVQCKWAQRVGDVVVVRLVSSRFTPGAGYVRTRYRQGEIDAVAAYCADLDRCYLLPPEIVTDRNAVRLRLSETKNGQQAGLNWASQYELSEAVARIGRLHDCMEGDDLRVPGAAIVPASGDRIVVSAHAFRDRFGHYMEIAGEGAEVNVTRYGRPFVRLLPVIPSDPQ